MQELPAINVVEKSCEAYKRSGADDRELQSVLGEESQRGDRCVGPLPLSDDSSVAVDEEIENEAVDDWVDLEVNAEAVEKP